MTLGRDTVLVTGGNSGIGFECCRELARQGWHVLMASRNRDRSAAAVESIRAESGEGSASFRVLDLGSLDSVRALSSRLREEDVPLKALVCNAGVQVRGERRFSEEGYELTFAVNHLGHFLLVNRLLETLRERAPARIVVVSSGVHDPSLTTFVPDPRWDSLEQMARTGGSPEDDFDGMLAYSNSKLCNLWFTYELVRRLEHVETDGGQPPITVNAFDPGLVPSTGLLRDYPAPVRAIWSTVLPALARVATRFTPRVNPAPKAGGALARLVTDPSLATVTGAYYPCHSGWEAAASSEASYDEETARRLWKLSVEYTGLAPGDSPLVDGGNSPAAPG